MNRFFNVIGRTYFKVTGWHTEGTPMPGDKCIFVAAYHTSNWDFIHGLAARFMVNKRISWLGKHTLFMWPIGFIMRALGGVPVHRYMRQNLVESVTEIFLNSPQFAIAVTPEGTRSLVSKWKSGFYYIALEAKVPLQLMGLDYPNKTIHFDNLFYPTGDIEKDTAYFKAFFNRFTPKYPELADKNFTLAPRPEPKPTHP